MEQGLKLQFILLTLEDNPETNNIVKLNEFNTELKEMTYRFSGQCFGVVESVTPE